MSTHIGRYVLFLHTNEKTPRNGEGTFLRVKSGAILFVYTKFSGSGWHDEASADIASLTSFDEGETWVNPRIIIHHDETSKNLMCPSLIRMNNGDIGLIFLKKMKNGINAVPWFTRSSDEGQTFSEPFRCIPDYDNYYVIENDHAIKLNNGRILIPSNYHTTKKDGKLDYNEHGLKVTFCSDDDGETWKEIGERQDIPFSHRSATGLQETALYEMKNGRIRAMSRTDMAFQYECYSDNYGESWSIPEPNRFFSSPDSPLLMKRACGMTLAVFNPIPIYTTLKDSRSWGRTPLVCAVSDNDGESFDRVFFLEDDPTNGYCYPAIFDGDDYALIAYYHSDNNEVPLTALCIKKIAKNELKARD